MITFFLFFIWIFFWVGWVGFLCSIFFVDLGHGGVFPSHHQFGVPMSDSGTFLPIPALPISDFDATFATFFILDLWTYFLWSLDLKKSFSPFLHFFYGIFDFPWNPFSMLIENYLLLLFLCQVCMSTLRVMKVEMWSTGLSNNRHTELCFLSLNTRHILPCLESWNRTSSKVGMFYDI